LLTDHMMVAWAYEAGTDTVHVHDTWDYADHTMTWGKSYVGLKHLGVTVLVPTGCVCSTTDLCCDGCHPINNDAACDDADACTQSDVCEGGKCVGASPIVCPSAVDDCHDSVCDPASGQCFPANKQDGTACKSDSVCWLAGACESGACVGTEPITCVATNECHAVGICVPEAGTCTSPVLPDGTPCSGGVCASGWCRPSFLDANQGSADDSTDSGCSVRSGGATRGSSRRAPWLLGLLVTAFANRRVRRRRGCAR